ncbi:MAG TPA: Rne/Rng family ribonuclease, partial [Bryobacteraceae bacterium]|nr:Rne/Rng family ribonuclease [Bryobacteraceae bacterium]
MQSAFVDLGLERDTFLYVSDFLEEHHEDIDRITGEERPPRERERGRERRPSRSQASAASRTAEPPLEAAAPAEAPAVVEAPAAEAAEDRGDRRGRRSRRRRGRTRGFPESKYASETPLAEGPSRAAALEAESPAEEDGVPEDRGEEPPEASPLILPGESLAKYRSHAPLEEAGTAPQEAATEETTEETAVSEEATEIAQEENEFDEPIHYPPENALPDAPVHPEAVEAEAPSESEPAGIETSLADEPGSEAEPPEEENEAESGPAVAPMLDEDEDRDIQAMILGEVDGLEMSAIEANAAGAESAQPPVTATEPGVEADLELGPEAAPAEPESGAAEVRERGGRYPHRISRRMRRRMRGQHGAEGRPEAGETAGPSAAVETAPSEPHEPVAQKSGRPERTVSRPAGSSHTIPSISDLLKEGQEIIVQIAKEPLGQKGARITSHIALPGRYVVYMPTLEHMGVSRKIASDEERLRLKRILQARRPGDSGGFITRTAAEGRTEEEIAADMEFLYKMWQDIRQKAERRPAPLLLHHDLDIVQRVLRDQLTDSFKAIWIDNEDVYENVVSFVQRFQPALAGKVKLYTREAPIFDAFGVTGELEKALRPKVWLKSGGYIVINQTEALVAIDVNTGKYVGKSNRLEDTIVKTNTEAIKEIVRQVRLRDLGGIIVIDFIDMDERKNRQKVMQALEEAMRVDRAPYKILQFNDFGLVAITRKRVKQSLERTLCAPCPHCEGAGYIKSVQTVVSEILTEARKMAASIEGKDVMLRVHPDVAKVLKSHQNKHLEELEEVLRRPVLVKSDPLLHHEKFDLA